LPIIAHSQLISAILCYFAVQNVRLVWLLLADVNLIISFVCLFEICCKK